LSGKLSHNEIIDGCIKNHRDAQEQLYRQFYESMVCLCLRYTRNQEDAMEIMQDGFLKVFRNISQYDTSKAVLYTWIRTIMIHAAIDFIRRKERFVSPLVLDNLIEADISNDAMQKLDAQELLKLIRLLPPATQTIFNLYVIEGYNHREISAIVGISEGTSKWHLSEARRQLKQFIQIQRSKV
jgi:RNA polymerase sigma factor (sigma-70 family)